MHTRDKERRDRMPLVLDTENQDAHHPDGSFLGFVLHGLFNVARLEILSRGDLTSPLRVAKREAFTLHVVQEHAVGHNLQLSSLVALIHTRVCKRPASLNFCVGLTQVVQTMGNLCQEGLRPRGDLLEQTEESRSEPSEPRTPSASSADSQESASDPPAPVRVSPVSMRARCTDRMHLSFHVAHSCGRAPATQRRHRPTCAKCMLCGISPVADHSLLS